MERNRQGQYTGIDVLETLQEAVNYNQYLAALVVERSGAEDRILDFGAGTGTFAEKIRSAGRDVTCVELDPGLRQALSARGFTVCASTEDLEPESFDVIYSFNVLEHIENDSKAVRELFSRLKPGGSLIIYVPAFQFLMSSFDRRVGHLRRYRLRPLAGLIASAGFEIVEAGYVDCLGVLAGLAYKAVDNGKGSLNPTSVSIYDRFIFPASRTLDKVFTGIAGKNIHITGRRPTARGA